MTSSLFLSCRGDDENYIKVTKYMIMWSNNNKDYSELAFDNVYLKLGSVLLSC